MAERMGVARHGVAVLAAACLAGCMMVAGSPRVQGLPEAADGTAAAVPVAAAVQVQVFEDAIHVPGAEYREEHAHLALLRQGLLAAGVMSEARPQPAPDALDVWLEIEIERSGPIALRVASMATFRLLPSWTGFRYVARARVGYGGRPLPAFEYERTATLIENVLLLPLAPFFAPGAVEGRIRRDSVNALVAHLGAALAAAGAEPQGKGP